MGELRLHDNDNTVYTIAEDLSHIDTRVKVKSFGGKSAMKYAILVSEFTIFFVKTPTRFF